MQKLAFAAFVVLGLIVHAAPSHAGPAGWCGGMCKKACDNDRDKIIACTKSDGGKFGQHVVNSYEHCKCDQACHKEEHEKMKAQWQKEHEKGDKATKGDKGGKTDKAEIMKKLHETTARVRACMIKAGVKEACLPMHRPGDKKGSDAKKE